MATDISDLTIGKDDDGDHARDFSSPPNRNRRPSHGDDGKGVGGRGGGRGVGFASDAGSPMTQRVPDKLDDGGGRGRGRGGRGGILPSPSYRPFVDFGRENGFSTSPMGVVPDGRNGGFGGYGRERGNGALPPVQTLWPDAGRGGGGGRARGDMSWESPAWQGR